VIAKEAPAVARRLVVRGRVQGVGFRHATTVAAASFGVTGWVRNRQDGSVEALVQGVPDAVERTIAWCRRGPPSARVTDVEVVDEPPAGDRSDFVMRPTV
jgi:acylphosphatase